MIDRRLLYELTGIVIDLDDKYQADESDPFEDDSYFADYDPMWLEDFASSQKDPI